MGQTESMTYDNQGNVVLAQVARAGLSCEQAALIVTVYRVWAKGLAELPLSDADEVE
jgi:hypothetical protein